MVFSKSWTLWQYVCNAFKFSIKEVYFSFYCLWNSVLGVMVKIYNFIIKYRCNFEDMHQKKWTLIEALLSIQNTLYIHFENGLNIQWGNRVLCNGSKPRVHGSYWQVFCKSDSNLIPDGGAGWQRWGGYGHGVWVRHMSLCHSGGEYELQWQHMSTLWLHNV